jgi:hypothetical protein
MVFIVLNSFLNFLRRYSHLPFAKETYSFNRQKSGRLGMTFLLCQFLSVGAKQFDTD